MSDTQIEWEQPTAGKKKGSEIRSRYTPDGKFAKRRTPLPRIATAKDLKAFANQLPDDLPIEAGFNGAAQPVWYNIGEDDEHLEFTEANEEDDDGE